MFDDLIAAMSKSIASNITYPFSLAKTRAQVSSQPPSEPTSETSEKSNEGENLEASKAVKARQRTVFRIILWIAKMEGIWALYQGLGAEVLKGFFSQGLYAGERQDSRTYRESILFNAKGNKEISES